MKKFYFAHLASGLLLSALCVFFACQKEQVIVPETSNDVNLTAADRVGCDVCVTEWIDSKVTVPFTTKPVLVVDISNDATTTYYTVRRTDGGIWADIRYVTGCTTANLGGAAQLTYPANQFSVPNPPNWQICNPVVVTIKITGAGGAGGALQQCFTYELRNKMPVANAGSDQRFCNTSTFSLTATPSIGTGGWAFVGPSGTAVITSPGAATTTVTNVPTDQNITLRWTETNGTCIDDDDVVIRNDQQSVANAGPDQNICGTTTFTMAAVPSVGTGVWSFVGASGTAVITSPNDANTTVTDVPAGTDITLNWTETNGTCRSTDETVVRSEACPPTEICYGGNETAWSFGPNYLGTSNWSTYTPYAGAANTVTVFAGQNYDAGTASFSAPDLDGNITITITLNAAFAFQNIAENVKIHGYAITPTWNNPSLGHFAYKSQSNTSTYTVTVAAANYYGVHLDVRHVVPCPD